MKAKKRRLPVEALAAKKRKKENLQRGGAVGQAAQYCCGKRFNLRQMKGHIAKVHFKQREGTNDAD